MNPAYAYADTGDYLATLIAYSAFNPNCNDTVIGLVHINPVFNSYFDISNEHCTNEFKFFDRSFGIGGVANFWKWNFGDDSISTEINPQHIIRILEHIQFHLSLRPILPVTIPCLKMSPF